MKQTVVISSLMTAAILAAAPEAPAAEAGDASSEGYTIYATMCVACHTIGEGKRIGPDLQGVVDRRDRAWLKKFIKTPSLMLSQKDPIAVKLLKEYTVPMPDAGLTDAQVEQVLAYLENPVTPEGAVLPGAAAQADQREATEDDIARGKDLFQGKIRFANDGPSCISCHDVKNDAIIGGGILAADLTTVFSRLGGTSVRTILGSPPFPVMQKAYEDMPLTGDEIFATVAFLQAADADHAYQQPRDYGVRLLVSGVVGVVVLLGLYSLMWKRRNTDSVNKLVFDRQLQSQ